MKNTCPFYIVFQVLKQGTSFFDKNLDTAARSFYFLLFLLAFTSADIIFHKFLEFSFNII